jgi:hypothetical protein
MIEEKILINSIKLYKHILKFLKNINFMLIKYSLFFHTRHIKIKKESVKIPIKKPKILFEKHDKIKQ